MAVDLGLRSGTAVYDKEGRLTAFATHTCTGKAGLRRHVAEALDVHAGLEWLVTEGDLTLAAQWERTAMRRGVRVQRVDAATWRQALAVDAAPRGSAEANRLVVRLARRIIDASVLPQPVVLTTDAAEAICVGLWAVHRLGWLRSLPVPRRALQQVVQRQAPLARRVANG